jgi:hypothetical protein
MRRQAAEMGGDSATGEGRDDGECGHGFSGLHGRFLDADVELQL